LQEFADRAGMDRPCPAKCQKRQTAMIDAAVGRMGAGGRRHRFCDDAIDAAGGLRQIRPELVAQLSDCRFRRRLVERHAAAKEIVGIEQAQHDVGVGHCGLRSAVPVAGRPRCGARAARSDLEEAEIVDACDAAAAGADLDHVDRGNGQRHAAALAEAIDAIDLETAGDQRLAILDQAGFCRRPAHVEGEETIEAQAFGIVGGGQRAGGRTALDHAHRIAARDLGADDAARTQHDERLVGHLHLFEANGQRAQIRFGDRLRCRR
jgi:hypothetical protein